MLVGYFTLVNVYGWLVAMSKVIMTKRFPKTCGRNGAMGQDEVEK